MFFLGIHQPHWLADTRLTDIPVFVSRRTFLDSSTGRYRKRLPRAVCRYAIDSGGFTELQKYGRWTITAEEYVAFLRRCWGEIGPFDFAAPQDWMCEPIVINGGAVNGNVFAGTRQHLAPNWELTLDEMVQWHQQLTVDNYLELRTLASDLPIRPVIQGFTLAQYMRCIDMYEAAGVDLTAEPLVCVGSVCRRQNSDEAAAIIQAIYDAGITRLHGFGFKIEGLRRCWGELATADSLSWSYHGRRSGPCQHPPYLTGKQPQNEANCLAYALEWRTKHIRPPVRRYARQMSLMELEVAA